MKEVKQVIVVRKDLNMRKGKIAAQVAHASMKVWFDRMLLSKSDSGEIEGYVLGTYNDLTQEMIDWKEDIYTKIVVGCETEDDLFIIKKQCEENNIPFALIKDAGLTEFNNNETYTCIAVGPDENEKIDIITKEYKLL